MDLLCKRAAAAAAVLSRTCRLPLPLTRLPQGSRCKLAGCSRTVYVDERTGRVHDFCGRSHANEAMANGEGSSPSRGTGGGKGAPAQEQGSAECSLEGCKELVYRDPVTKVVRDRAR